MGETVTGGLSTLNDVFSMLWDQVSDVVTTITTSPVLMIGVGIWVGGAAI